MKTYQTGYSAYSPDLEECVATGRSREEVEREMQGPLSSTWRV